MCSALSLAHDVIAGYPPPNMNTSPTHSPVAAKVPLSLWRLMEFKGYDRRMREMVSSNSLGKKRCRLDDDNNYCSESLCTLPFISQPPPTLPLVQTTKGASEDGRFQVRNRFQAHSRNGPQNWFHTWNRFQLRLELELVQLVITTKPPVP